MKKLLGLLGALGMVASTGVSVVSCGKKNEAESIGKVSLGKNNLRSKDDSTTLTVELNKDLASADKITVSSNKGEDSLLKVEETNKETKKVVYKVSLKNDLPEDNISEALTVKLNDKEVGSVEIKIFSEESNDRAEFDLSLIEEAINHEGIAEIVTKNYGNKGYLSVEPGKIKDQNGIIEAVKTYVTKVLEDANNLGLNLNISVDTIITMVNIDFLDSNGEKIIDNNTKDINSIKISIKEGHENDIDGYKVSGEANVKVAEKKDLTGVKTNLDEVTVVSESESIILNAVKEKFGEANPNAKDAVEKGDFSFEKLINDSSKKTGSIEVTNKFNSSVKLTNDEFTITFNYKIDKNGIHELDIEKYVFKNIDSIILFTDEEVNNDDIVNALFDSDSGGFSNQLIEDDSFYLTLMEEEKVYGFDEEEFKQRFLEIFNINIASDKNSFVISVKNSKVFEKANFVGGPVTIKITKEDQAF
ncbi:lipoprotein [Spiroplasma apis]|uniref:Lipoprotein n=1 Tax=Spiroplasma apis B31 TaxID=1276258 RepID=V5RIJ1_SPIAP|nr:lipoprotein [Spiroplasma apis]AHB36298.1 hypothetical protein SAPIS_v1c04530 [Spiroplasma apis B31]